MPRKTNDSVTAKPRATTKRTAEVSAPAPRRHKKATPVAAAPSDGIVPADEIATLAFSYWESRGYQGGSPEEDWLRAENDLLQRHSA